MKVFLGKIILFVGIIIIILCLHFVLVFTIIAPQYANSYNASIIEKMERLESIDQPKIILVGNSNLAFGIDSELLESKLQMPVVNLGLHAALGNVFHENMVYGNIHKGDIVIICHTDYDADHIDNYSLAWITIENHFELWKLAFDDEWFSMLKALPDYMLQSTLLWITGNGNVDSGNAYSKNAFNKYGDNIFERHENIYTFLKEDVTVPKISKKTVKRLNELNAYCEEQEASLLIAGYPIAKCEYTPENDEYKKFQEELQSRMECDVISDFTNYIWDENYFYDAKYHLTEEGVQLRTEQLIVDIHNWMQKAQLKLEK